MKLSFLGTKAHIDTWNRNHRLHSSCRVSYREKHVTIDCGEDWLDRLDEMNPRVLLLTHAHPDHAGGLAKGADCPVKVTAGGVSIFYAPDVVYIKDRQNALSGIKLYVGDGATLQKSLIRKSGDALMGHSPVRTQLTWCKKEGVPRAVFTHCGAEIVNNKEGLARKRLREMAEERGVKAEIARDGMEIVLR